MADPLHPRIAFGLRAQRGGAVVVALAIDQAAPSLLLSTILATHEEGDRLTREPYHVATELVRDGGDIAAVEAEVAHARLRQGELAAQGLRAMIDRIAGNTPVRAGLLVNRAGWITDLLHYSLGWQEHAAVAEGLAVRDALRFACRESGIAPIELDEKSLEAGAPETLGLPATEIDATLKAFGKVAGPPWRKEQKLAALAAWAALAEKA